MRVEATRIGFYHNARRRPGDVFDLAEPGHYSPRWMRQVADDEPERTTGSQAALDGGGPAPPSVMCAGWTSLPMMSPACWPTSTRSFDTATPAHR